MLEELEVLKIVSERLAAAQIPFMLTGSFAMAYYGKPRMTRDLDLVVALAEDDVDGLAANVQFDASGYRYKGRFDRSQRCGISTG